MMAGTWTEPAFEAVARLLGARTGLAFAPSRCDDAEAGIRRAMARARIADAGRYLALLETTELALDDLITELTVGETYFFREPAHFELIRREVIPDVLRRRGQGHALRVWSAGCASGEEAYSLAIVVEEAGSPGGRTSSARTSRASRWPVRAKLRTGHGRCAEWTMESSTATSARRMTGGSSTNASRSASPSSS